MSRGLRAMTIVTVLALALTAVTYLVFRPRGGTRVTAYFSTAVGLYEGSTVRVLGIPVGIVDKVTPEGRRVKVELAIDSARDIPATASAVVVAPSLVSDRFVQLTPAYAGGARMESGDEIPVERTITPVELDELYKSLSQLSTALGPNGANSKGELSRLLDVLAANTKGNGALIGDTIKQFAEASKTLAGAKDQIFGTVEGLQQFTTMLVRNDGAVVQFTHQLQDVSSMLAAERADLGGALAELAKALEQVKKFISENRTALKSNVDKLTGITQILVDQRKSLAEALDNAPNALGNMNNAINPKTGAMETRTDLLEYYHPSGSMVACNVTPPSGAVTTLSQNCKELKPGGTDGPPLALPAMGQRYTSEGGR